MPTSYLHGVINSESTFKGELALRKMNRFKKIATLTLALALIVVRLTTSSNAANLEWLLDTDGDWDEPTNWSSNPALPGPTDNVSINRPGTSVTVFHRVGDTVLQRLDCAEYLALTGGSLTVTEGASNLDNSFYMNGATLRAIGDGTLLTAVAPTLRQVHLMAEEGGYLNFLNVDSLIHHDGAPSSIQAVGENSRIRLAGLRTVSAAPLKFVANGANSLIEMPDLTSFEVSWDVELSNGGDILAPISELRFADVSLTGAGDYQFLRQLTSIYGANITMRGGASPDFGNVQRLYASSIIAADGAQLHFASLVENVLTRPDNWHIRAEGDNSKVSFPVLRTISEDPSFATSRYAFTFEADGDNASVDLGALESMQVFNEDVVFRASGDNSRIDVHRLGFIEGFLHPKSRLLIEAIGTGSVVDASNLAMANVSTLDVTVSGPGAIVDLSRLEGTSPSHLVLRHGGELRFNGVNGFRGGSLTIEGAGEYEVTKNLTSFLDSRVEIIGSANPDFSAVIEVQDSPLIATDGGQLRLPALTSLTQGLSGYRDYPLWATGQNSVLDLRNVADVSTVTFLDIRAIGPNAIVDFSSLPSFPFGANILLQQGDLLTPGWEELFGFTIAIGGNGEFTLTHALHFLRGGHLTVFDGASPNFDNLESLHRVWLSAQDGGVIALPNVASLELQLSENLWTFEAVGNNSRISLPRITTLGQEAVRVLARGEGALLDLPSLEEIPAGSNLNLQLGADFNAPLVVRLNGTTLHASGESPLLSFVQRLQAMEHDSTLLITDSAFVSIPNLTTFHDSHLIVWDASAELPGLSRLTSTISLEAVNGVATFPGVISGQLNARLTAGTNGRLEFPNWTSGQDLANISIQGEGSEIVANKLSMMMNRGELWIDLGGHFELSQAVISGGTVHVGDGSISLDRNWLNATRIPGLVQTSAGVLHFDGQGVQAVEASGMDLGGAVDSLTNDGNFAFGQIIVGTPDKGTRLNLVDLLDNGQRGETGGEAMYLLGIDGAGLQILGGSALFIGGRNGGIDLYAAVNGAMVHLNELFSAPNSTIPFDDGFVSNVYLGDVNLDGAVNDIDLDLLNATIRDGGYSEFADIDGNGLVDLEDVNQMLDGVLATTIGDVNLNGGVDVADLNLVRNNFGLVGGWSIGDVDGSGLVGIGDLNAVRNHFGFRRSGDVSPVPEPTSLGLAAVIVGLGIVVHLSSSRRVTRPNETEAS
ncbi:MAG: hypothetical protein SGJ19_06180 [Planctomycetia bacterium]|nr:hypothetical protein [Planctomycetia bacterium]